MKGTVKILHKFPFFKANDIQNICFDDDLRPKVIWGNHEGVNMSLRADEEGPIYVYRDEWGSYTVTRNSTGSRLVGQYPNPPETELC